MGVAILLLGAAITNAPQVELTTLDGDRLTGQLRQLSSTAVIIETDRRYVNIPTNRLLEIRFSATPTVFTESPPRLTVALTDGARITADDLIVSGQQVSLKSPVLGRFSVPLQAVSNIRLGVLDSLLHGAWTGLLNRPSETDLLVIQKGDDVLDHLEGVIGEIDDKSIKFLLDGDEISVSRNKVFGLIFLRRRPPERAQSLCQVRLVDEGVLWAEAVSWDGDRLAADLTMGSKVFVPVNRLESLDFSRGKISYLSAMEPREIKYTPFFDVTWKYRRDRNLDGGPIRLGQETYARGLCIHSRTYLRYRLGKEFRKFQAMMGIDRSMGRKGHVHVVVSGDGQPLLETDVQGGDEPRRIDLDVAGVLDLEILVDFGKGLDIADHLDLADAKVTK